MMNIIKIDGKDYIIVDALEVNNNRYLLMGNENDYEDLMVRKVIVESGEEYITKLESEEELQSILEAFRDKHRKDFENE